MAAPLVILGYGNPSRGDDALAPLLLGRIGEAPGGRPGWEVIEDFQLQVEHALDLAGRDLALFIDADASCQGPFRFTELLPVRDASFSTHAISPAAVLQAYRDVHRKEPPPSFVLGIRGESFELGAGLSPAAESSLESAWIFLKTLLETPSPDAWRARLSGSTSDQAAG